MCHFRVRDVQNVFIAFLVVVFLPAWKYGGTLGNKFDGIRGIETSEACFGADGLDLTSNKLHCRENERVCIWDVVYGVKDDANISCPHAIAATVHPQCCHPEPGDCIIPAGKSKVRDLILECHYLSTRSCTLQVDRLNSKRRCRARPGITATTFRSITYVCAPLALVEPGKDPCRALPPRDSAFWEEVKNRKESGESLTSETKAESAAVLIVSIIGFSVFLVIFVSLLLLGIRCSRWMVDADQAKLQEETSSENLDAISLKSSELGRTVLYKNYNVYVTIPRCRPRRPRKLLFCSNNDAKWNKRYFYNKVLKTPLDDIPKEIIRKTNERFPILDIPLPGHMGIDSRSSPPSYHSRLDSPTDRSHVSLLTPPPGYMPGGQRPSDVTARYQRMVYGDYFAPSRRDNGDYFSPYRYAHSRYST